MTTLPFVIVTLTWINTMRGTVVMPLPFCWYVTIDGRYAVRQEVIEQYQAEFDESGIDGTIVELTFSDFPSPFQIEM